MIANHALWERGSKIGNSRKWLRDREQGLPRVSCTFRNLFCTGATPISHKCKRLSLPGSKRPFAPSRNHFWEFPFLTSSPKQLGLQPLETILACESQTSPELLETPWTSQNFPELPQKFPGNFPTISLTVDFKNNPEVSRKFRRLAQKFPRPSQKYNWTSPEVNPISGRRLPKRAVSQRVVLADVPPERKPERGYIRMLGRNENRNEGAFAKTTFLRNRPFISQ